MEQSQIRKACTVKEITNQASRVMVESAGHFRPGEEKAQGGVASVPEASEELSWNKGKKQICVSPHGKVRAGGWNLPGYKSSATQRKSPWVKGLLCRVRSDTRLGSKTKFQDMQGAATHASCTTVLDVPFLSHFDRALHQDNVSVNLFVVNKPWLFSLLWCAGVDSVTTNDCQLLQQMHYPIWLIVRVLGLLPFLFFSHL